MIELPRRFSVDGKPHAGIHAQWLPRRAGHQPTQQVT
jgi:hypothetical protein